MKKILLGILAVAGISTASYADVHCIGTQDIRHKRIQSSMDMRGGSFDFMPVPTSASKAAMQPMRAGSAENSLDFTLAFEPYTALRNNNLKSGTIIYQAFEFTAENCERFDGMTITSINITSGTHGDQNTNGVKNVVAFLADDLDKDPFYKQSGELGDKAFDLNKIKLETPYTISKDKPFVVGYYCKPISTLDYYLVVDGIPTDSQEGGYYGYKDGKNIKWGNIASGYGNLCIGVTIEGDNLPKNGVSTYMLNAPSYVEPGKAFSFDLYVAGAAANDANSMTVEYTVGSQTPKAVDIEFEEPVGYNSLVGYTIPDVVCNETGAQVPLSVKITKVNGVANTSDRNTETSTLLCFEASKGFKRTHVIEEGTGTWCGYCPAGIVLMEYIRDTYPDDFIRLALHCGQSGSPDPMEVSSAMPVISLFSGFPMMLVDRVNDLHPTSPSAKQDVTDVYEAGKGIPAIADVAELSVEPTGGNGIKINSAVKFAINVDNNDRYRMAYYLSEDGMGPYKQHNYYEGGSLGAMGGWEKKDEWVSTIFDDVVRLLLGRTTGFSGSISDELVAGELYKYSTTASTDNITGDKYFVTAIVMDNETGEIANARQIVASKSAGVDEVASEACGNSDNRIYSMDGRYVGKDLNALESGIYIVGGKKVVK